MDELEARQIENLLDSATRFEGEIDVKYLKDNFGSNVLDNIDDLDDAIGYGKIVPCVGRSRGILDVLIPVASACSVRPGWRDSEIDAKKLGFVPNVQNLEVQPSYKLNPQGELLEGKWGEVGTVRPDYYDKLNNTVYEIKNYDLNKNISGLKKNIANQIQTRKNIFGEGVEQIYIIDIRGQNLNKTQQQIMNEILDTTGLSADNIKFMI